MRTRTGPNYHEQLWRAKQGLWSLYSEAEKWLYSRSTWLSQRLPMPDFVCIGAPQSGTTWLYANLCAHPDIRMAVPKEVRFFESINRHMSLRYHYSKKFKANTDMKQGEISPAYSIMSKKRIRLIRQLLPDIRLILILRSPRDRTWAATRRAFSRPLFRVEVRRGLHFGPALNRGVVGPYLRHCFETKGCGLSNNVQIDVVLDGREWLVRDLTHGQQYSIRETGDETVVTVSTEENRRLFEEGKFDEVDAASVRSFITCDNQRRLNDYPRIMANWLNEFPKEQLLIINFDSIRTRPVEVLTEVFAHIGVSDDVDWNQFPFSNPVNRNLSVPLPEKLGNFIETSYKDNIFAYRKAISDIESSE